MLYRMRTYEVAPEKVGAFTAFFRSRLLPVQQRHGARLVGRWVTEDSTRVVAIWEYDSRDRYEAIERAVREDPDSIAAQVLRRSTLADLVKGHEEVFMTSTVPVELTIGVVDA